MVGAGHATGELATSLRQNGHTGHIVLIGEGPWLPYQRPPPSKAFLAGEIDVEALYLKPQATNDKAQIEFMSPDTTGLVSQINASNPFTCTGYSLASHQDLQIHFQFVAVERESCAFCP